MLRRWSHRRSILRLVKELTMLTDEQVELMQGGLHDIIRNSAELVHYAVELHYMLLEGGLDLQLLTDYQDICFGFKMLGDMKIVDKK